MATLSLMALSLHISISTAWEKIEHSKYSIEKVKFMKPCPAEQCVATLRT